ncbi:MAG: rhodanese-like domain-containing protein [Proteobacteria bacterium]|nr:rhodanese-like domain-containing protein [Pseudomonadota bacterium]MDA0994642.1 rhodanese-like domain-containing protein [Pseudomonadota bacterium]
MVEDIAPAEFVRRRQENDRWLLIDVREIWEIEVAKIGTAVAIPMMEIPSRQGELDKARPIAVICHSGGRSRRVADFLFQQGFAEVVNIAGGIDAWSLEIDSTVPRY